MLSISVLLCSMELATIMDQVSGPKMQLCETIQEKPPVCPALSLVLLQTLIHATFQVGYVILTLKMNHQKLREVK